MLLVATDVKEAVAELDAMFLTEALDLEVVVVTPLAFSSPITSLPATVPACLPDVAGLRMMLRMHRTARVARPRRPRPPALAWALAFAWTARGGEGGGNQADAQRSRGRHLA